MNKEKINITEKFDIKKEFSFKQSMIEHLNSIYGLNIKIEYREDDKNEIRR